MGEVEFSTKNTSEADGIGKCLDPFLETAYFILVFSGGREILAAGSSSLALQVTYRFAGSFHSVILQQFLTR